MTYQWLRDNLPVQGDGTTHFWTQGPTFDKNNLWDPAETVNLKDKGALKGTDLKDICNLVGGADSGDTVQVLAADGYNDVLNATNIYSPVPRQGPLVICWWNSGQYTGAGASNWGDGMLLAFFATVPNSAGQLVFGHQDMHDCLPQSDWHFFWDGSIQYPSTDGLYVKWVNQINIYTVSPAWSIDVKGNLDTTAGKSWFENGVACQHAATYTDSDNKTWSGMPLGFLCGLVDDTTNVHGPAAFNFDLARAGYTVTVLGSGGSSATFSSVSLIKNGGINGDILVANTVDNATLTGDDYPLKLVGSDVGSGQIIRGIYRIVLSNFPPFIQASAGTGGSISPSGNVQPVSGGSQPFTIAANAGYHILDVKVDDSSVGAVRGYTMDNVTSYHTIAASFAINTCTITATASTGGTISPLGAVAVNFGDNQTFTLTANPFYRVYDVSVDGGSVGARSSYTFSNVTIGHTIAATFAPVWDLNNDHICNISDVVKIGLRWGQTGSKGWIPEDLNNDGVINISDVVVVGLFWGQNW